MARKRFLGAPSNGESSGLEKWSGQNGDTDKVLKSLSSKDGRTGIGSGKSGGIKDRGYGVAEHNRAKIRGGGRAR